MSDICHSLATNVHESSLDWNGLHYRTNKHNEKNEVVCIIFVDKIVLFTCPESVSIPLSSVRISAQRHSAELYQPKRWWQQWVKIPKPEYSDQLTTQSFCRTSFFVVRFQFGTRIFAYPEININLFTIKSNHYRAPWRLRMFSFDTNVEWKKIVRDVSALGLALSTKWSSLSENNEMPQTQLWL